MLWQNLGLDRYLPLLLYAVYLTWASILNVVSSLIVDRVGRVRLLVIGIVSSVLFFPFTTKHTISRRPQLILVTSRPAWS